MWRQHNKAKMWYVAYEQRIQTAKLSIAICQFWGFSVRLLSKGKLQALRKTYNHYIWFIIKSQLNSN